MELEHRVNTLAEKYRGMRSGHCLQLYPIAKRKKSGSQYWDWLIESSKEWSSLEYTLIASSRFGDDIIITHNSPLHPGQAIYMHGPDVAGPRSPNKAWPESVLYLGSSIESWLDRVELYGDEHAIGPGGIDSELKKRASIYKAIYRQLNPGLEW
jgi:hypothetical protein